MSNDYNNFLKPSPSITLPNIRDLSNDQLEAALIKLKQPRFRSKQLFEWLWVNNAASYDEMSNIPKQLREELAARFSVSAPREVVKQTSNDGSRKYLLAFDDGTSVECVGMPTGKRLSVCVSTQAGCGMACTFCATGKAGLTRSLKAYEIYQQVMHVQNDFGMRVSSIVLMGQGEPFNNYDETLKAMRFLNSPNTTNIGARHITVSTCGIIPQIAKFAHEPEQFTLAVSLHSAVQETRNRIMPGVRRWSLVHLWSVIGEYVDKTGRRPTYEYALMAGINDSDAELKALCDFCEGTLAHVNLIQLNQVEGSPFLPSTNERAQAFVRALAHVGVEATVRVSRGSDIDAACGQLKQRANKKASI